MFQLRIPYSYDADQVSSENGLRCPEESRTHQEFREESDINTIITRFGIGEEMKIPEAWITDVDIFDVPDNYQAILDQMAAAKAQFMSLPARIRNQFQNDPAEFLYFVSDPSNTEEMVKLGLAIKREETPPPAEDEKPSA